MAKQLRDPGWGMSVNQVEDFYLRWREVMLVAHRHGAVVVAAYEHKGFFGDLLERLVEDSWWTLQVVGGEPVIMFDERVPRDELLFSVGGKLVTIQQVVKSRSGFGRFGKIHAPSRDGVRPWSSMPPPRGWVPPQQSDIEESDDG